MDLSCLLTGRCPKPLRNRDVITLRSWLPMGKDYIIMNYSVKHAVSTHAKKTHKATFAQPGLVHFHLTLFMWVHIRWVQNQFSVVIGKTKLCLCFIYRFTLTHVLEHFLERMVHVHCTALVWDGLCNTVYTCLPVMFFLNTKQTTRLTVWLTFKCGVNPQFGSMSMIVTHKEEEDSYVKDLTYRLSKAVTVCLLSILIHLFQSSNYLV